MNKITLKELLSLDIWTPDQGILVETVGSDKCHKLYDKPANNEFLLANLIPEYLEHIVDMLYTNRDGYITISI